MKNKITVIVPCFNQGKFLDNSLGSIYNQTYSKWECLIIDDGSTDDTKDIALSWCQIDSRFIYQYQVNKGLSSARNIGLQISSGDYIQFLDADDYLVGEKLNRSIEIMKMQSETDIVITNFKMFSDNVKNTTLPFCDLDAHQYNLESILFNWEKKFSIPIHCALFKSELFENFRFPEELRAKEDWVMWLSMFKENPNYFYLDEQLVLYREHSDNMTKNQLLMNSEMHKALSIAKSIVPQDMFTRYLMKIIEELKMDKNRLITTIHNYKNSKSYVFNEFLKNLFRLIKF